VTYKIIQVPFVTFYQNICTSFTFSQQQFLQIFVTTQSDWCARYYNWEELNTNFYNCKYSKS